MTTKRSSSFPNSRTKPGESASFNRRTTYSAESTLRMSITYFELNAIARSLPS